MDLGIIGLGQSGKSTVFAAVTRGHAHTGSYGGLEPSIGVVKQPDERLDKLCELLKPRKETYAEVRFLDFPGGISLRGEGPAAAQLAALAQCDALVHVARAFEDESVPHPEGGVDAHRDIGNLNMELAFTDAAMLERREERLDTALRSGKADDRDAAERELALVRRLREGLERDEPLRAQEMSAE
ncbi:MAG: GTPase, partial [Dehalococcoidia bacterium]